MGDFRKEFRTTAAEKGSRVARWAASTWSTLGASASSPARSATPSSPTGTSSSRRFTGATGRAFLFNKVVNLRYSDVQVRQMLTGRHIVRDVSCKNCNVKLGWVYEYATEDNQRYKEGKVILERALVNEQDGIDEESPK